MNNGGFDLSAIPSDALSGAIAQLSAHPELISTVASMLGGGPPKSEPTENESAQASASPPEMDLGSLMSSIAPAMAALGGKRKKDPREEHRDALLCALKPYLNEERRRVLEHILQIGQLGDILKMIR